MTQSFPTNVYKLNFKRAIHYKPLNFQREPGPVVHTCHTGHFHKLRIWIRESAGSFGEVDFVLSIGPGNYEFAYIYCLMEEPNVIFSIFYHFPAPADRISYKPVNREDDEMMQYMIADFITRFLPLHYSFTTVVPEQHREIVGKWMLPCNKLKLQFQI